MSTFTSVLKKIGQVIVTGAADASTIMGFPFISQILGSVKVGTTNLGAIATTATADFNTLAGIVSTSEVMGTALGSATTGAQKLTAATPLVQQALMAWATSNLPGHSAVKDPVLLQKAAAEIAGGFADAMNAFGV